MLEVLRGGGAKLLISARVVKTFGRALDPAPIRGRLLLETRRLLEVLRVAVLCTFWLTKITGLKFRGGFTAGLFLKWQFLLAL